MIVHSVAKSRSLEGLSNGTTFLFVTRTALQLECLCFKESSDIEIGLSSTVLPSVP